MGQKLPMCIGTEDDYLKCGVEYCIYNDGFACILSEVQINASGSCESCITLSLDADFLDAKKELQRREMDRANA